MKLGFFVVVFLVVLGCIIGRSSSASAMLSSPEPLSPVSGSVIENATTAGVALVFSSPGGPSEPVFVEVSQYPSLNSDGTFADPLALLLEGEYTHDPSTETAKISPYWLSTADSLLPVYWHPYVIECTGQIGDSCKRVGPTWTFSFTSGGAPPNPVVTTPPVTPSKPKAISPPAVGGGQPTEAACEAALREDKARVGPLKWAVHKLKTAKTRGERHYWSAQVRKRTRLLNEATRNVNLYCP